MAGVKAVVHVRIDKEVYEKLTVIAADKSLTKTEALSRIICYYAVKKLDMDEPTPATIKDLSNALSRMLTLQYKIAGSTERTEAFIKSLIHDDRPRSSLVMGEFPEEVEDGFTALPGHQPSLVDALSSLRQFIESAKPSLSFDGHAVMQITIPTLDFNKLKSEYERLCTSLNI